LRNRWSIASPLLKMGEEIAFEYGRISDFQGLVTLTLTLHRVILHSAYRHASLVDLHLNTKCHWNRRNFLWTDVRTGGRTFETDFIRSTRRSRPKKALTFNSDVQHFNVETVLTKSFPAVNVSTIQTRRKVASHEITLTICYHYYYYNLLTYGCTNKRFLFTDAYLAWQTK